MSANAVVRARIDPAIRDEASAVLADWGLTVSDALRMTLTRIAREKRLPFSEEIPNALTRETIEKAERGEEIFHAKDAEDLFRQLGI
ncbi:type II toxin-antitoxin system RelB/DinJ family antitoxin [Desulfovibrio sp. ZJ200]|uniref:type II toxin-antitoxin system RelB/DinJ family antitoxin n=1 Tax=Desulfovibrio sp. ZJ200 TaxID=2709792 RepID=UPI0013EB70BF|nr:type II toxin-antitoxin system RelB/DinJ family antitoxin [Desulfovibrio sp. ZJ200]